MDTNEKFKNLSGKVHREQLDYLFLDYFGLFVSCAKLYLSRTLPYLRRKLFHNENYSREKMLNEIVCRVYDVPYMIYELLKTVKNDIRVPET